MSTPWHDLAEKALGTDDRIEKTYSCRLDKQNGYLCLGRHKMVFVSVKGFLKKSYDVLLDAPYTDVGEIKVAGRYRFDVNHDGKSHPFETSDISAKTVVDGIQEIVGSSAQGMTITGL